MKSHRSFPPGRGNLKIPVSSRQAARAGLALYSPCRPKGRVARWVAWKTVGLFGPLALPGNPVEWHAPMEGEIWGELAGEWRRVVGPFNGLAVHERSQASRRGFAALLLRNGAPAGFVKVRDDDGAPIQNEYIALESLRSARPHPFEVPEPIAVGKIQDWHYLITSALEPDLHRMPLHPPIHDLLDGIRSGLESLPRPPHTLSHWEPMHGDFTPWNLRERRDGSLFLIDWEDATWAPPGADETFYWAVCGVLGRPGGGRDSSHEVISFWRERLEARHTRSAKAGDSDTGLGAALLSVLNLTENP